MSSMMTVKEVASLWNIPDSLVTRYCRAGRIEGAVKQGRSWLIPANACKPLDLRRSGNDADQKKKEKKLPLPIGVSDVRVACDQ